MKQVIALTVASLLSACGGSFTEISQSTVTQSKGTQKTASLIDPITASGFATAASTITGIRPGTAFTLSAREISYDGSDFTISPFEKSTLKGSFISQNEIELEVNGQSYRLDYDPAQERFQTQNGAEEITVFLSEQNQFATIATAIRTQNSGFSTQASSLTGIIGYVSDPARLPAQASYEGTAILTASPETGASDQASGSLSAFADFTNGTLIGQISLSDPKGDTSGPVDLGDLTIDFDHPFRSSPASHPDTLKSDQIAYTPTGGLIDANTFQARLNIATVDLLDAGIYGDPNLKIEGAFYGPSGENLVGIATGSARTGTKELPQDVLLNLTVNGEKQ